MAFDSNKMSELQKALNDASNKTSALWIAFITFELYLAIGFGSITHRDLLLNNPVKLPVFNVELPLVGFFSVSPAILVIFHFYVSLQILALANKARFYSNLLKDAKNDSLPHQYMRHQLDSFLILQFIAGPSKQRTGVTGLALRFIAWITLVAAPIVVLLQGQVTFLPYHLESVQWLQRLCILVDLMIAWFFWRSLCSGGNIISKRIPTWSRRLLSGLGTAYVVIFSFCIATYRGEWAHSHLPGLSLREPLFHGDIDEVTGRPNSFFSNRLVVTDQYFYDPTKLALSFSFRGRDLRDAVLNRSDMRKADFTGAILSGASLDGANLQNARFGCVGDQTTSVPRALGWPVDRCTWLERASFQEAQLQGAFFDHARAKQSSFDRAQLQAANLSDANLQGAGFFYADLTGALLNGANLRGAILRVAKLTGTSIHHAKLESADLTNADLRGAWLDQSELEGASLIDAWLQGASLFWTRLQGTNLSGARLKGASLKSARLWRAQAFTRPEIPLADVQDINTEGKPWEETVITYTRWKQGLLTDIPETGRDIRVYAIDLLDPTISEPKNVIDGQFWKSAELTSPFGEERQKALSAFFAELVCSSDTGAHIMNGLIRNGRMRASGAQVVILIDRLAKAKKDKAECPGARSFTDADWARLDALAWEAKDVTQSGVARQ